MTWPRLTDLRDLGSACAALALARFMVATRPIGALVAAGRRPSAPVDPATLLVARRLARAVIRGARLSPVELPCLVRAIALQRLLEARRIEGSRIEVGVRWDERGFVAHAWVEYGDAVLGDHREHVREFAELTSIRVR